MGNTLHITLNVNFPNGDEYEVEARCNGLGDLVEAIDAEIEKIGHAEDYSSLVVVLVPL